VKREEGRHKGAGPQITRHHPENRKQEKGVENMKKQTGQVVRTRMQTEQVAVRHVGKPRQGMPVVSLRGGEGAGDVLHSKPPLHPRILGDILRIIIVDEVVIPYLPVHGEDTDHQHDADV